MRRLCDFFLACVQCLKHTIFLVWLEKYEIKHYMYYMYSDVTPYKLVFGIYSVLLDFKLYWGVISDPKHAEFNIYVYAAKACFNILNKNPVNLLTNIFLFK